MCQCFLNYPEVTLEQPFVLDFQTIAAAQALDNDLLATTNQHSGQFQRIQVNPTTSLIAHRKEQHLSWKICLPSTLLLPTI